MIGFVSTTNERRGIRVGRLFSRNALAAFLVFPFGSFAQERLPPLAPDLPVTNGLIRWWPNLFDAHDEITGQEGVVMGLLPPVEDNAEDSTEFGPITAWVQLKSAITNQVFTFSFWVWPRDWGGRLLGQESSEGEWFFRSLGQSRFFIDQEVIHEANQAEYAVIEAETWHHVAIARREDGTSSFWVDGIRKLDGRLPHPWPGTARWLTVGNPLQGGLEDFRGRIFDLCAFDRVLSDVEIQSLNARGLRKRPAKNTAARRVAAIRPSTVEILTNVLSVSAQNWTHHHFTTEDGLPGTIVKAVLQAQNGYLWVGTEEGLARFDGKEFRAFTSENTPALKVIGQTVWSLAEERDGTIWAGIFGGLLRIRNLEFTAFTNGLPQRFILQAEPAGDGSLWVAGFNAFVPRGPLTLRRYFPEAQTSSAELIVPGHLRRLVVATNGLWMATETPERIYFWNERSPAPSVLGMVGNAPSDFRFAKEILPANTQVRAWKHGPGPNDWWTSVTLNDSGPDFYWFSDARLNHAWVARWNGLASPVDSWLGVSYGLARLRGDVLEKLSLSEDSTAAPEISCLCANREGGIWFGTEQDGLHLLEEKLIRVFTKKEGLAGNDVRSIGVGPGGILWAATDGGLSRLRDDDLTIVRPGRLRGVATDQEGVPWCTHAIFGEGALYKAASGVILGLDWQDPNTLHFSRDGTLWVTCERGLTWIKPEHLKYDPDRKVWVPDPTATEPIFGRYAVGAELPKTFPLGLVEDTDGSIWMGTLGSGLFHVKDGRLKRFTQNEGLPGDNCVPVHLDHTGALWIVTEAGLSRHAEGGFRNVSKKDGLPNDLFLDLIEDDLGNFWITGKRGIHRVTREDFDEFFAGRSKQVRSLTLGTRDGLLTPECSSYHYPTMAKTADGHIWVATRHGLATFDPTGVRFNAEPLPTTIERLVVNKEERAIGRLNPGDQIKLRAGSGERLEVHFSAVSLSAADRIRFRYRMDGSDADWSAPTDLRLAFYTNLRPGPYRFRVAAANAHGVWNDHETTLEFVILPFFWQTTTFYSVIGLAAIALAGAFHQRRLAAQRRTQQIRLEKALLDEKSRIAADMHDELGATLTQIAILGEVAKSQTSNPGQTRSTLERISQAARDLTSGVSELVWATDPHNEALESLLAYLREHAASQLNDAAIRTSLDFPQTISNRQVSAIFRRNLLLILKEALNNIVKHSAATEVEVTCRVTNSALTLEIHDNGGGFDPTTPGNGHGLANMQKRTADIGGQFRLRSAPGQGTSIDARVPLGDKSSL
jgi:signal transduction histidine kinase/ligand-binding sensor domain-containing protein